MSLIQRTYTLLYTCLKLFAQSLSYFYLYDSTFLKSTFINQNPKVLLMFFRSRTEKRTFFSKVWKPSFALCEKTIFAARDKSLILYHNQTNLADYSFLWEFSYYLQGNSKLNNKFCFASFNF